MIAAAAARLAEFVAAHPRLVVLTGAGCSTDSGIPDYRDAAGGWKPGPPVMGQDFIAEPTARQRYWSRSIAGWPLFRAARPNAAHAALAELESRGHVAHLITQNVDGLHQRAGSRRVSELHGALGRVRCLGCEARLPRDEVQQLLERANPRWLRRAVELRPDGDAEVSAPEGAGFVVPDCPACGGTLKPDVVFFGESVPAAVQSTCMHELERADALLCVGSSLMVYSGFRFCRRARELGMPVVALNLGRTRADDLLAMKIEAACGPVLQQVVLALSPGPSPASGRGERV